MIQGISEIDELNKQDINFKETSISKENMGKYNIYEAINNTKEQLYISMPAVNIKNETTGYWRSRIYWLKFYLLHVI